MLISNPTPILAAFLKTLDRSKDIGKRSVYKGIHYYCPITTVLTIVYRLWLIWLSRNKRGGGGVGGGGERANHILLCCNTSSNTSRHTLNILPLNVCI